MAEQLAMKTAGVDEKTTTLQMSAICQGEFVVVTGTDRGRAAFTDDQLNDLIRVFNETVKSLPNATPDDLQSSIISALNGMWVYEPVDPDRDPDPTPFDCTVKGETRLIFYIHSDSWGFHRSFFQLKQKPPHDVFGKPGWLKIKGSERRPRGIEMTLNPLSKSDPAFAVEFDLMMNVAQRGGLYNTPMVIDPRIKVEPPD